VNEQEIENQINIIEQQLFLTQKYPDSFIKILGKKGLENFIDNALDKLFSFRKELEKIRNKKE